MRHPIFVLFALMTWDAAHAEPIYPKVAEKAGLMELGAAVFLLMPEKGTELIDWSHRADGPILWLTDGFRAEKGANSESVTVREGLLRVNVLGQFAHVLKQQKYTLA